MSMLSKFVKGTGKVLGKGISAVGKVAQYVPGVGVPAAALAGGLGSALQGHNLKNTLRETGEGATDALRNGFKGAVALAPLALGGVGGLGGLGGLLGMGSSLTPLAQQGGSTAATMAGISQGGPPILQAAGSGAAGGGFGDFLKGAGSSILNGIRQHPDALLGAASGIYGAVQQGKADKNLNRSVSSLADQYKAAEPLRAAGLKGLYGSTPPDLSALFADPSNPFSRRM
jgi:hypothetical protein